MQTQFLEVSKTVQTIENVRDVEYGYRAMDTIYTNMNIKCLFGFHRWRYIATGISGSVKKRCLRCKKKYYF